MARVLIVEDELIDRIILERIVQSAGHDVYLASGGEQALHVYMGASIDVDIETRIDVIVTDLQMPGVDGLEVMEALRPLFPDVAIIIVSGKGPELLAAAKDAGALVALSKPVDAQDLLEAIAQAAPEDSVRPPTEGS